MSASSKEESRDAGGRSGGRKLPEREGGTGGAARALGGEGRKLRPAGVPSGTLLRRGGGGGLLTGTLCVGDEAGSAGA